MKKLILCVVALSFVIAGNAQTISVEVVASGFNRPIDIQNAGDDRLFIVEQDGVIQILSEDGNTNGTPFLNIESNVNSNGERGLLGLAFHPDYATNGFLFVHYSNNSGDTQISRFSVSTGDSNIADPNSELEILTVSQPDSNHNGGTITFGPDGFLYIGLGDGGGAGDTDNNAQNPTLLLGKMLRIDIDNPANGNEYGIPADNPFIDDSGVRDEIWATGLRNPFRFSIDDETNTIWIGDVGQNAKEEVNKASLTEGGLNYGWRCYEGNSTFNTSGCPNMNELTFPVFDYAWNGGGSVIGGYVYRGTEYSDLQNVYIFADIDGMISTIDENEVYIDQGIFPGTWVGFGEDINNKLYATNLNGNIYKIVGGVLSIEDNTLKNAITLFPNPATNQLTLTSDNQVIERITIYDVKGSLILEEINVNTFSKNINVSGLTSGLYITEIATEDGNKFAQKLVIK